MAGRKKRSPLPVIFSMAAVVLILGAAVYLFERASTNSRKMDLETYYGITSDEQAALVVNDTILQTRGMVRDGTVYIDYPTVWNSFNNCFYWEPQAGTMLLTLPEGTLSWTPDDGSGAMILEDGIPYLSAPATWMCAAWRSILRISFLYMMRKQPGSSSGSLRPT